MQAASGCAVSLEETLFSIDRHTRAHAATTRPAGSHTLCNPSGRRCHRGYAFQLHDTMPTWLRRDGTGPAAEFDHQLLLERLSPASQRVPRGRFVEHGVRELLHRSRGETLEWNHEAEQARTTETTGGGWVELFFWGGRGGGG